VGNAEIYFDAEEAFSQQGMEGVTQRWGKEENAA